MILPINRKRHSSSAPITDDPGQDLGIARPLNLSGTIVFIILSPFAVRKGLGR